MVARIISIINKIRQRKLGWLLKRLILEFRIPETSIGKKLNPFSVVIFKIFLLLKIPLYWMKPYRFFPEDTLYVFYDLEVNPVTFNFCEAMALANIHRIKLGLKFLYVVFVPGPLNGLRQEMDDYEKVVDFDARQWRKFNLLFTIIELIPCCIGFVNCATRKEAGCIIQQVASNIYPKNYQINFPISFSFADEKHNSSENMMPFKAPLTALRYVEQWLNARSKGRKIITITLRQYNYMPQRNSNITAWANFAKKLDKNEYTVIIIPDTENGMEVPNIEMQDFLHFNEGCWNVGLRTAIYESAYLNLGINNGPFILCWLNSNCRYIMFKILTPTVPQTTELSLKNAGHLTGKTPPFAKPWQKWIWEDDDELIIEHEFICYVRKHLEPGTFS